jgi:crotonobetainyl-CoA:carnitine CoA-transferase CaiB-like acyl-CoA transferase
MPQAQHRALKVASPRSDGVEVAAVANPIRLSATPVCYRSAAPKLGEHTEVVLTEWLHASSESVAGWRAAGAFGTR